MIDYIQTAKQKMKEGKEIIENNKVMGYAHSLNQLYKIIIVFLKVLLASLKIMKDRVT